MADQQPTKTEKFRNKLDQEKNIRKEQSQIPSSKEEGITALTSLVVGISQLTLIFFGYSILASHFNLEKFLWWEFGVIGIGAFSLLTYTRNYIKDLFKKS